MAAAAEGSLPRPVVEAAVEAVAPAGQALRQLALALAADPGALARGTPPVAGKLAAELIARGSSAVTVPACAVCGRTGKPLTRGDDGAGVCQRCRSWQRAVACASCGKVRPRAGRDATGQDTCEVCSRKHDPERRRTCGRCGKTSPVAVRGRDGHPDICVNCCKMPVAACSICGRNKECNFAATARPVCIACSPRATATCARCGQDRPPAARWPEGPVCDPCYTAALRHRGRCVSCSRQRRLVAPPGPGADTCADCAGIPVTHACADCDTEDKLYEKGRCARCSLRRRARDLLSAGTGIIPAQLSGVFDAVTAARQPRSALNWLRNGAGAGLLADVAAGRLAISHQALDAHPHRRAAGYLRHMLTAAGALPARDEELARAGQWPGTVLDTIEAAAGRRLVQAYATWQVMRRLRASAAAATRPRTPTAHARNHIRAATSLLAWLRGRGTELAACGQADIDQWLRTGPPACLARDFLAWAATRGHCRRFSIPPPPRATGPAISQDQRWALTARLLHDTALDATDPVAGCLLLLYGQPLTRIAAMTTSQVTRHSGETFLRLGRHHVPVPGPLASAVARLISGGRSYRGAGSPPATTWLFPGHLPGRPITPARLGERLRAIGIYAQTGRRAALPDLAAQLPPAVLADIPGLHETTAAKWMHQAGGDWSRYAAELARHPHQP
ncbi:hypothetical protein [Trebonia sp.]|uniref:hypothetical protein n=1 Tax=Trebonia sp. TaxID=2767075 RepID=UPI002622D6E7|nr:hypothetical protein [Trebonia sp.]